MNYFIDLKGGMNIRRTPEVLTTNIIRQLPVGTRVEGDELSADGKWLKVLLIGAIQTAEPTWIATYTTSGKLETNPELPPLIPFPVALNILADSPMRIQRVNEDGTKTEIFTAPLGEYVIDFVASSLDRPYIRME